jgi:hypothetical protein
MVLHGQPCGRLGDRRQLSKNKSPSRKGWAFVLLRTIRCPLPSFPGSASACLSLAIFCSTHARKYATHPSSGLNTFGAGLPHAERIRLLQSSIERSLPSCNHLSRGNREAVTNSVENLFCYGSMTMNSFHRPAASQISQSRSGKPRWPVEPATPTSPSVYSQIIQIHGR